MDGFVKGAKQGAVHRVQFVHALDLVSHVFWRSEVHGDVDTADHQDSFLCFHLPGYVGRQSPVAGINLARFQRASKGSHHSTGSCRNDIIQG